MQSNSKGNRHVRGYVYPWLGDMPTADKELLQCARRRLNRDDLALEAELENNETDWWMFEELCRDDALYDNWYHEWLVQTGQLDSWIARNPWYLRYLEQFE